VPIAGRTREQLRTSIGYNLGAFIAIEADASGSTTRFLTDDIFSAADDQNGKRIVFTSGSNDGEIRRVTDTEITGDQTKLTFAPAVGTVTADTHTAELWHSDYSPEAIHDFINQAILHAYGRVYDPEESLALHADGKTARFDIPSEFAMVSHVYYRTGEAAKAVHPCNRKFDETEDGDFTQAVDDEDYKRGASLRLTIGGSVSAGDVVTDSISSVDLSGMTHLEGWVKATSTLAAADFVIRLDDGTVQGDSTDLEILNVPATTAADTWTFFRIALATPEKDTAIISVGLEYNANQGANTVWFDDLRATRNDDNRWRPLEKRMWQVDISASDLILTTGGVNTVGYALLKIVGGDDPALLTTDATANEIDDEYVIYRATELAMMAGPVPSEMGLQAHMQKLSNYARKADDAERKFPLLVNARRLS
jgi:hypothetical protein